MSETIRSYSPPRRNSYGMPVAHNGLFRKLAVAAAALFLVWLFWTTRDNWPMERLIPREQTFSLRARHLLATRQKAAASPIWDLGLLPRQYQDIRTWLGSDFGLPEWVLNNLVSDVCYVSGKDLNNFSDLLVVTRMSRIGCLLERYYGIADDIEEEYAGGLELRRMGALGAYYAVRGRTLVFSRSREALIGALTLQEQDGVETLEETVAPMAGDLQGRVNFRDGEPLAQYVVQSDFGLRFDTDAVTFTSRSALAPEWKARFDQLAAGKRTTELTVPAEGSLVIGGDLNTSLPRLWTALDEMSSGGLSNYWNGLPGLGGEGMEGSAWAQLLEGINGKIGSSFSLRWTGFDYNGIVPIPEMELFIQTEAGLGGKLSAAIPLLPAGQSPTDFVPYRVADSGVVRCPVGWGSVLEPNILPEASGLRVTLHPRHMQHALAMDQTRVAVPGDGDLFLRIRPVELLELLREGGMPYVHAGLLRGYTPETFESTMVQALAGSRQVSELRLTAAYDDGAVVLEVVMQLAKEPVPAEDVSPQPAASTASE